MAAAGIAFMVSRYFPDTITALIVVAPSSAPRCG